MHLLLHLPPDSMQQRNPSLHSRSTPFPKSSPHHLQSRVCPEVDHCHPAVGSLLRWVGLGDPPGEWEETPRHRFGEGEGVEEAVEGVGTG